MTHTICTLQRAQPVCRFKAKTLVSLHTNQTTQATIFFDWQQECFDIKDSLYNQFFIITSTDFWTFCTFHPSLHESVALDRVLGSKFWVSRVLGTKYPGFWIWPGSVYAKVMQCSKYMSQLGWICQNLRY